MKIIKLNFQLYIKEFMNEKDRFLNFVWPRIEAFLVQYSQASFKTWIGPYIWNEDGDLKRVITNFCQEEFGIFSVHNESKIAEFYFKKFKEQVDNGEREKRKTFSIDIDITDARECQDMAEFREIEHKIFIEVKGISTTMWAVDVRKKIDGYEKDCAKLNEMVENDFCKYAFAILIDNGDEQGNYSIQNKELYIEELKQKYSPVVPLIWQIS